MTEHNNTGMRRRKHQLAKSEIEDWESKKAKERKANSRMLLKPERAAMFESPLIKAMRALESGMEEEQRVRTPACLPRTVSLARSAASCSSLLLFVSSLSFPFVDPSASVAARVRAVRVLVSVPGLSQHITQHTCTVSAGAEATGGRQARQAP